MGKEKLELQVNIPTTIKLLQKDPATGENNYGTWWLYNVECNGTEYSYFAPEKVVNILKENNVGLDDEVVITKKLIKNGKKNLVDYEVCVLETTVPAETTHNTNGYTNSTTNGIAVKQNGQLIHTNGNGNVKPLTEPTTGFSKDYPIMLQSMNEAFCIKDELGGDIDVTKLGITLFLRKVKP